MATSKKNMAAWRVDEKDFPRDGSLNEKMQFLLRYAVLAPSFCNSQPWQFFINDQNNEINLYVHHSHWLKVSDPNKRELHISLGCALENLLVSIDYFGLGHCVAYFPESGNEDWAVRVRVVTGRETLDPRPKNLFKVIDRAYTSSASYKKQIILDEHMSNICDFLINSRYEDTDMIHRIYLDTSIDFGLRKEIGRLVSHSDTLMFSDPALRQELSELLAQDAYGNPWWFIPELTELGKINVELGEYVAKRESQIVSSAPVIGLLSSSFNDPTSLIKIGQAYERIALETALVGVGIYPLFQLLELFEMKSTIQTLFTHLRGYPQLIFAMGYMEKEHENAMTPRIPVEEVMLHA